MGVDGRVASGQSGSGLVQVAGIVDEDEAAMLVDAGVDWLGFPFGLPVHGEDLTRSAAARIAAQLPAGHQAVLITYLSRAAGIAGLCDELGVDHVQLHGRIDPGELDELGRLRPDLVVVKSLVVGSAEPAALLAERDRLAGLVDYFITDTHDPATGADGATGRTHDWEVSRELVAGSPRPVLLAGGLDADNVAAAISRVRPAGVDAHTRLEGPDGRKEAAKVEAFVRRARAAFAAGPGGEQAQLGPAGQAQVSPADRRQPRRRHP